MSIIITIILVILVLNLNSKYKKILRENKILKKKLNLNGESFDEVYLEKDINDEKEEKQINNLNEQEQHVPEYDLKKAPKPSIQKKFANEKEKRNIAILITGAICIVLSAIVFLMSTWNSIPSILKTIVLILLTAVFFGGSYIAKEKFKLPKASQTFFYIAMAYIPICLLSISVFELFGTYLSVYGEGKYIYLTLAAIFVSLIYYLTYMNKNNKYLLYGSVLSQLFSIIAFSLIFSNDILIISINLLLYNILLMLITKRTLFKYVYNSIPAIIMLISMILICNQSKTMIFVLVLLALNYLILEFKKSLKIYSYIFNALLVAVGLYFAFAFNMQLGSNNSHLFALFYVIALYVIENLILLKSNRKNMQNSLSVATLLAIAGLHVESFINTNIVAPYIVSILQIILLTITYIKTKSIGKDITAALIPIYFSITGINIMAELGCSYHFYIIFALLTFTIGEAFRKIDKLMHVNIFTISHILIALTYITVILNNFEEFYNDVLYAFLLTALHMYSCFRMNKKIFKYLSYITLNLFLLTLFEYIITEASHLFYLPIVSTLTIMGIELVCKTLKDKFSNIYLAVSQVIAFASIYIYSISEGSQIPTIVAILFATAIVAYNIKNKAKLWNILPLACAVPALFFNDLMEEFKIGIMLLALIATTVISLRFKKISVFTLFSGVYLAFTAYNIENIYLNEILFICWSAIHFLLKKQQPVRDIFKFMIYLSSLLLYNTIIAELQIETCTLFSMLGYVIVSILALKTILIKYIDNTDILDYFILGIIYLIALMKYNSEMDGMLFTILIIAVVITSYIKKYGAVFMVSIFAILANVFALTKEFWFSVPWWAYLLTIGAILIGFAIKNEISDKKTEINALNLLKRIKEKVDK